MFSTENTKNKILLFSFYGCFLFSFLLKMFSKIQPNTFSSPFYIFSENENKKQLNQTHLKADSTSENHFSVNKHY